MLTRWEGRVAEISCGRLSGACDTTSKFLVPNGQCCFGCCRAESRTGSRGCRVAHYVSSQRSRPPLVAWVSLPGGEEMHTTVGLDAAAERALRRCMQASTGWGAPSRPPIFRGRSRRERERKKSQSGPSDLHLLSPVPIHLSARAYGEQVDQRIQSNFPLTAAQLAFRGFQSNLYVAPSRSLSSVAFRYATPPPTTASPNLTLPPSPCYSYLLTYTSSHSKLAISIPSKVRIVNSAFLRSTLNIRHHVFHRRAHQGRG